MKRITTLLFVLCSLLLASVAHAADPSAIDQAVKRGTLRVGFSTFAPWAMQTPSGEYIGFEIDVATRLAKDLGLKVEFVPTQWAGIIPALQTKKFDVIIGGMGATAQRNLSVNFSIPYDYSLMEMFAHKELAKGFATKEAFNKPDVVIAVRLGSSAAIAAKTSFPLATLRQFDDEATAVQEVLQGRAHAMVSSAPLPAFETLKNSTVVFQPLTEPLSKEPIGFAVRKGDADSLNVFDNWIRAVEAEGWLENRRNYWFKSLEWEKSMQ